MVAGQDAGVCAIIVCFRPESTRLTALIQACLSQSAAVVLINNGEPLALDQELPVGSRIHLIEPRGNLGLAAAQNLGVRWAVSQDFPYLIFFDQDSVPQPGMIKTLREAFDAGAAAGQMVAAVGPSLKDGRDGAVSPFVRFHVWGVERIYPTSERMVTECDFLISSGMFTSVKRFMAIGQWEEDLFVDNVDMEWCFRARSLGYRCLGIGATQIDHLIGDQVRRLNMFGRSWSLYSHSPTRQYYMMRNRVSLYKRHYVPIAWKTQDVPRALTKLILFGFVYRPRWKNLRSMLEGVRDGWLGRLGS